MIKYKKLFVKLLTQRIYAKSVLHKSDIADIIEKTLNDYEGFLHRSTKNRNDVDR